MQSKWKTLKTLIDYVFEYEKNQSIQMIQESLLGRYLALVQQI